MVDHKSGTYRPRRALIEPDVEPAQPERRARPGHNGSHNGNGNGNRNGRGVPGPVEGRASASSPRTPLTPPVDEDYPKPLYREDAPFNGYSRLASRAARVPADPPTQETLMTPANLAPRPLPSTDDETTTILPRSRPTKSLTQALDAIDDYDDEERRTLSRGAKLGLVIGAVAVVVVIGLLIGYAVRGATHPAQTRPSVSPSAGSGSSNGASRPAGQSGNLLTDASMLNPRQAKTLDRSRTWKVVTTPRGATENGPTAACFGGEPPQGQPTPQQEFVRVLKGGKTAPSVLHAATAYNSLDEASLAYQIASKTLGGCAVTGSYIEFGRRVSGIGDQAVGVVVMEVKSKKNIQAHSVILNRTGRVMNIIDAVQPSKAIAIDAVAQAMGQVTGVMCEAAGGQCGSDMSVKKGPPPLGGDEPGFLALGDLPPAGPKIYPWVATEVKPLKEEPPGSGCESVKWTTEPAKSRSARDYLIQESGKDYFGLNEIMLTTEDAKTANKLVDRLKSNLSKCKSSKLTARVTNLKKVTSVGVKKTKIAGWTAVVTQKSTDGWVKYRVGIVSAGSKVIYTFLNPSAEYDFRNHQWNTVAVRAGERATQVS
jgi:hypothetical protein